MDDIVTLLDSYESRSAIRLAVAMDDGTVLTSSFLHDRGDHAASDFEFGLNEQQFRSIAVLASVMQNEAWSSLAEHQYRFCQYQPARQRPVSLSHWLARQGRGPLPDRLYAVRVHRAEFLAQPGVPAHRRRLCAAHLSRHRVFLLARVHAPARLHGGARRPHERARLFPPSTPARAGGGNPTRSNSSASRSTVSAPISSRPSASSRSPMISLRRRYAKRSASTICAANSSSTSLTS